MLSIQEGKAVRELVVIDSGIAYYSKRKQKIQKDVSDLTAYTSSLEKKLRLKNNQLKHKKILFNKRIQSIYKDGETHFLEVLIKSKTINDILNKMGIFELIADNDTKLIKQIEKEQQKINSMQEEINSKISSLRELESENQINYSRLILKQKTKKQYLNDIKQAKLEVNTINDQVRVVRKKMDSLGDSNRPKGRTIKVLTTGYGTNCPDCGTNGTTSTGMPAGRGVAAVSADPSSRVVPLGTKVYVPGYGKAVIGDIGGGVASNQIDLGFETHGQALSWGSRWVNVTVID